MPYRRLPNTDNSRLKTLQTALSKGKEIPPFKLAFTQKSLQKTQTFLTRFEKAIILHKQAQSRQVENNKKYQKVLKKAKLFISHFIQVMNMAITRSELPASTRTSFGINEKDKALPAFGSEKDISYWGKKLLDVESFRILQRQTPITNPTIAVVKVRYEQFLEAHRFQQILKLRNSLTLEKLSALRDEADEIILSIWNEVESSYKDLPDNLKRERAKEYGLVYIYRKNEKDQINFQDSRQKDTG
ncbi:hypothetical protein ES708_01172 [subsurface metagenome]